MTESTGSPDTMQVGVRTGREIEVDYHVDGRDVDSSCEQIRSHHHSALSFSEIFEHWVLEGDIVIYHFIYNRRDGVIGQMGLSLNMDYTSI